VNTTSLVFLTMGLAACLSTHSNAAGFYIQEQSVSGLGNAFAGQVAMPRDASIIYYNPAGMTYLKGRQGNIGVHFLAPYSDLDDKGTTVGIGGLEDTDNAYGISTIPNLFYSHQLNSKNWIGFGVTAPFGLSSEYDDDWFGRFDSLSSDLTTLNFQPSYAHKVNNRLSLGAGIDIQYADAELTSARYLGIGLEGKSTLEGDDISYGYNFGFIYEWDDATRIAAHYRSQVNHKLDGKITLEGTGTALDSVSNGTANLNLPEMASFGLTHQLDDRWTIMGGATWFGWSNYERITAITDAGVQAQDQAQGYKNSLAFNIGADYKYSDDLTLRGGIQYDETPTQDGTRSTRTPDGDRIWVSGGATYNMNDRMAWDFAATYIHIAEEDINLTRSAPGTSVIDAENNGHVGILAVGLNYKF
jgi:long-chain fatty acid transport protein